MQSLRLFHRSANTITIFLLSLAALLTVSAQFVLPHFTTIEYKAQVYHIDSVEREYANLTQAVQTLNQKRVGLLDPIGDSEYREFIDSALSTNALLGFVQKESSVRSRFTVSGKQLVTIQHTKVQASSDTLTIALTGKVVNADDRSFLVLSSYIQELEAIAGVLDVEHSDFKKYAVANGAVESPFTLTITLSDV